MFILSLTNLEKLSDYLQNIEIDNMDKINIVKTLYSKFVFINSKDLIENESLLNTLENLYDNDNYEDFFKYIDINIQSKGLIKRLQKNKLTIEEIISMFNNSVVIKSINYNKNNNGLTIYSETINENTNEEIDPYFLELKNRIKNSKKENLKLNFEPDNSSSLDIN